LAGRRAPVIYAPGPAVWRSLGAAADETAPEMPRNLAMTMILDFYGSLREHRCGICGLAAQRNRAQGGKGQR
jgi:hypothetical protein